jgi:acetylornithine/succinyldiaminopimelate/putrescine aminotransferase
MTEKEEIIQMFAKHVSSGKVDFFKKYGMNFVMGKREGPNLYDMEGEKKLFNLHCNGGVFNLGHRNREIIETLKEALEELDIGNHHLMSRERARLAKMICDLMPGDLDYVVFGVSGGEAVDLAIKVARAYTNRSKIISAVGGYHGHTGLSMAAGDKKYREPFGPAAPGFIQVPFGDLNELKRHTDKDTAAIILETVPSTLGMVIPPREYIQAVRKLCDDNGILLIMDEVQSGLGRTGELWGFTYFDIIPDMVILGKGLSGGIYPITATVMRKPLESVFHPDPFIHISTFGGSEIGCRVACKVLEISSSRDFLDHVVHLSGIFRHELEKLGQRHSSFFTGIRQLGLMIGLELKSDLAGPLLTKTAYDQGLLIIYANNDPSVCQFLPPLVMKEKEVEDVIQKLDKALSSAKKLYPLLFLKNKVDKVTKRSKKKP